MFNSKEFTAEEAKRLSSKAGNYEQTLLENICIDIRKACDEGRHWCYFQMTGPSFAGIGPSKANVAHQLILLGFMVSIDTTGIMISWHDGKKKEASNDPAA